jgi:carbon starvation protein
MNKIIWIFVAIIGAICFGYLALQNGETVSAMYLIVAAVCIYAIGYRFAAQAPANSKEAIINLLFIFS